MMDDLNLLADRPSENPSVCFTAPIINYVAAAIHFITSTWTQDLMRDVNVRMCFIRFLYEWLLDLVDMPSSVPSW
jgi:hypothetical protein